MENGFKSRTSFSFNPVGVIVMENTFKQNIFDALVYSIVYFFSFQLFSKIFVDGRETGAMFLLISLLTTIFIFLGVAISGQLFSFIAIKQFIVLKAVVFFIICEIIAYLILSEIAFFGLFQNLNSRQIEFRGQETIANNIYHFRMYRNMTFSLAGFISSVVLTTKYYLNNKK